MFGNAGCVFVMTITYNVFKRPLRQAKEEGIAMHVNGQTWF